MLGKSSIIATWPSCFYKEWRIAGAISIKAYEKISQAEIVSVCGHLGSNGDEQQNIWTVHSIQNTWTVHSIQITWTVHSIQQKTDTPGPNELIPGLPSLWIVSPLVCIT